MKTVKSMAKKWPSFLFLYVYLDLIPCFEKWSMYKFYISFTPTTQNQSQIPSYHLNTNRFCQDYSRSTRTSIGHTTELPPCTKAHIIFPAQSERKLLPLRGTPWEECAETISCLVNLRSQAQLLKMVTDLHSNSVCAAVSTDHIPAPFTAYLINPFIHS